jgi:hypothetical protein
LLVSVLYSTRERSGMEGLMALTAEHDAFPPSCRRDLLPKRRVSHIRELSGMMDLAEHIGCTTVFAFPGMESVEDIGPCLCEMRQGDGIRGGIQRGQAVEVLQGEDLNNPLFPIHREADGKSIPGPEAAGYLIHRQPKFEG